MQGDFAKQRLLSLDTYRGMVLVLLMLESVEYGWQHALAAAHPSFLTRWIEFNASHTAWAGCSLWDLIQPSFMFMVGVSMPFSFSKRQKSGASFAVMLRQAAVRALVLILLGVFLRTTYTDRTNWTFEDVITQIGLGYVFLFLLWNRGIKTQFAALGAILVAYWMLFALWPLREAIPDPEWKEPQKHLLTGFFAHWNINANPGHYFDRWFLNLFPRGSTFTNNGGGYATLSFIPTLGTMILGLVAGLKLKSDKSDSEKLRSFLMFGIGGIVLGLVLHYTGICPLVKRIWTPTWTIFSGGACFLLLAVFYYLIDMRGWKRWAFWLVVIGMNSIAIYVITHLWDRFIIETFKTHLGQNVFKVLGDGNQTLLSGGMVLIVFWLILYWMYRKKIFIRI